MQRCGIMRKPLQVYLDTTDLARLESWAQERGWTKSQAIRAAVRALTRPPADDPILGLIGMLDGLPPDVSENFDRYLNETYVAERAPEYAPRRRNQRPRVRR
jgi:hypothetical protein